MIDVRVPDPNGQQGSYQEQTSICDVWRESVHKVITKAAFQNPLYLQAYINMQTEFLHGLDTLFGTCYVWQKQYFDRLGIDQNTINAYAKYCETLTEYGTSMMDSYAQLQKHQADIVVSAMKAANNYARQYMDVLSKAASLWSFNPAKS